MAKGNFSLSIRKFAEKVDQNANEVVRHVALSVGTSLVDRSPVGDPDGWLSLHPVMDINSRKLTRQKGPAGYTGGRFKGNWQLQAESPSSVATENIDPSGQATIGRFRSLVATMQAGGLIYYSNNLPYAQRLEGGWSKQAPSGMVEITAIEFQDHVNQAVQALPK